MQITAAPVEEACSTCNIRHLCPVNKAVAGTWLPGKEQKKQEKQKLTQKAIGSEANENLRSDLVNWDDIMEKVVARKIEDLRTHQSSLSHTDLPS